MCKATVDHASAVRITIVFIYIFHWTLEKNMFVNKTATSRVIARNYLFNNVACLKGFQSASHSM